MFKFIAGFLTATFAFVFGISKIAKNERVVTAAKGLVEDAVYDFMSGGREIHRNPFLTNYTQYRGPSPYQDKQPSVRRQTFSSPDLARDVLESLREIISSYGSVSVADLYELCGDKLSSYKDDLYGWVDLDKAAVITVEEGDDIYYFIDLPDHDRI